MEISSIISYKFVSMIEALEFQAVCEFKLAKTLIIQ